MFLKKPKTKTKQNKKKPTKNNKKNQDKTAPIRFALSV
jgi:hypothetical protein